MLITDFSLLRFVFIESVRVIAEVKLSSQLKCFVFAKAKALTHP